MSENEQEAVGEVDVMGDIVVVCDIVETLCDAFNVHENEEAVGVDEQRFVLFEDPVKE